MIKYIKKTLRSVFNRPSRHFIISVPQKEWDAVAQKNQEFFFENNTNLSDSIANKLVTIGALPGNVRLKNSSYHYHVLTEAKDVSSDDVLSVFIKQGLRPTLEKEYADQGFLSKL